MAELHIVGQILKAVHFEEPKLFCKWSVQSGSPWSIIQGASCGQTSTASYRLEEGSTFAHPLDIHLATRGLQGWPKLHLEVFAVNSLRTFWPVGYGFSHIPSQPGFHTIEVSTWKLAPKTFCDQLTDKFWSGGLSLNKTDLVYSGNDRYKLQTKSSGKVIIEIGLIFRDFKKFGIEF